MKGDQDQIISHVRLWLQEMEYRYRNMKDKEYMGIHWPQWSRELHDILDGKWVISKQDKKLY